MQGGAEPGRQEPGGIAVLLVDDEQDLLDLAREFLAAFPELRVHTERSAETGLAFLAGGLVDAIVSDYGLPGADGIAFLKTLRTRGDQTPFILFTGRGAESVAMEALNAGADFYLTKGGDPSVLFAELRNMIGQAVLRRRAQEEALELAMRVEQQAQVLDEILSAIADPVLIVDPAGLLTYANIAGAKILGLPRMALLGRKFSDLGIPEESAGPLRAATERVFATGERAEAELPWPAGGAQARYRCVIAPLHAPAAGRITAAAIIFRDVSDESRLAQELEACRSRTGNRPGRTGN